MGLRRRLSKKWNETVNGVLSGPGVDVDSVNTDERKVEKFGIEGSLNTTQTIPGDGSPTTVEWQNINNDEFDAWDANNYEFVVPKGGWYRITAKIGWDNPGSDVALTHRILISGTSIVDKEIETSGTASDFPSFDFDRETKLAEGDTIGFQVSQDTGSSIDLLPTEKDSNFSIVNSA